MDFACSRRMALQCLGVAGLSGFPANSVNRLGAAPAKKRIRIGQIGVGHAHAGKLAVYRESRDYEVVGVVETDPALRQGAEGKTLYQGLKWLTRKELLETPGLDAVLVETKVKDLLENAEACVNAGKHVHIDKPAGDSLPHFKRILDRAAEKKLLVQMGYMYRYNPGVLLLREFLKKGWLGEVFEVHAVMSKVVDPESRRGFGAFPGGMMFELGCHILDLVIGVLGKPARVTGYNRHSSTIPDGLKDNALAVLEYPRALATVKATALEVEGFDRRHLVVCGTEGTFHIQPLDNPTARISLSRERENFRKGTQEVKFPKYNRYVEDSLDMARILRGEKATDFSFSHDLAVQETLLKACRLDENGKSTP